METSANAVTGREGSATHARNNHCKARHSAKRCAKKCLEKQFRGNPLGNRFCGSMHSTIDAQLPQKVPKQKTCQTPRKWVLQQKNVTFCIQLQQK